MTREELIEQTLESDKNHVMLEWATRVGKSACSFALIRKWNKDTLVLVPNLRVKDQWKKNLALYGEELSVNVVCYSSLHKVKDIYDIVILDEFHLLTAARFTYLEKLNPKHWIALSATPEIDHRNFFRALTRNNFYHSTVTIEQGVEWGILPKPKINIISLELDNTKPYLVFSQGNAKDKKYLTISFNERFKYFKSGHNLQIQCTEKQYYQLINERVDYYKNIFNREKKPYQKQAWLKAGNDRKKFLGEIKSRWIKRLMMENLAGKRVLVFVSSITQAEMLYETFSIHSKKDDPLSVLDSFNRGDINVVCSVKMIDMGIDAFNVDACVISQLDNAQASPIQRTGRIFLSENPEVYVFYFKDTRDEDYLNRYINNFPQSWLIHR
jgi:superfamily II DNA or RNA helicase